MERAPHEVNWNNIQSVQEEITRWASQQFPHRTDHHAIYKLMVEEIPELATHKKEHGTHDIGPELADCFVLLMDLASLWGVDVAEAIHEKMKINYTRTWVRDVNGIMQHSEVPANEFVCVSAERPSLDRCDEYPDCICGEIHEPATE